jgi:transposase InsO family protein
MKSKDMVRGLEEEIIKDSSTECDICLQMKAVRLKFDKSERPKASGKLDVVHTDICGPMRIPSVGGARYFITFLDDCTRKTDIFLMKDKSQAYEKFVEYKARVERETGRKIKALRSDNGGEFCNARMDLYLAEHGIKRELTTVYTPQQNGASERLNRTLIEKARCLLKESCMPERFWGEAVLTANIIRNHLSTKTGDGHVPIELWTGRRPSVRFFRTFGCRAYVRIPRPQWEGKFGARAVKGVFVGYDPMRKAYRVWSQEQQKILHSRDVQFLEHVRGWEHKNAETAQGNSTNNYAFISFDTDEPDITVINQEQDEEGEEKQGEQEVEEEVNSDEDTCSIEEEDEDSVENANEVHADVPVVEGVPERRYDLRERTASVKPSQYIMVTQQTTTTEETCKPIKIQKLADLMKKWNWPADEEEDYLWR